ncbi:GNAT family N-acetyltransferase [Ancylobacter rudongensis]|uniref:Predicted N-acetyltransferase YhbS n=1 Tax=Ancylobacter rudongensis TaxID=177413 RepID=A0A1G4UR69_9HYPH|nr:GNAT family N-acetyltransferase [Ancylobacter rudongensis]SCW96146.1 Predicted N-acetyltransferase YhbS [Ancylobacter rudongensis]
MSEASAPDATAGAVVIEPATRADLPAIVAILARETLLGVRDSADPAALPDYERAFDDIAADPRVTLYVARLEGRVVGTFQLVFFRALLRHGTLLAHAEAVQVDPDVRGKGVGGAMMEFAIAEARRRGAGSLQLASNKARADAHRFYERAGFQKRLDGFKIDLSGH